MLPLLLALWLGPQEKPPEKPALSGSVVDFVTGEPLAKVEVTLQPLRTQNISAAVTISGDHGRFALVDLEPGDYHLRGKRSGYIETSYGAKRADGDGALLHLSAGQNLSDISFRLIPGGVISGTVRDSDGEPIEDAHLVLSRRTYESGFATIESFDSADTDDLGQYRFRKVPPGRYFVIAEKPPSEWSHADHSAKSSGARFDSLATMYPGVASFAAATPVDVTVGRQVSGIDIKLLHSPVVRVRGRVNAARIIGVQELRLVPPGTPESLRDFQIRTYIDSDEGDFVFDRVPPGSYILQIRGTLNGSMSVDVGEKDIENLRLASGAGGEIHGRITAPDGKPVPGSVYLASDRRNGSIVHINEGKTFGAINLAPGQYTIQVFPAQLRQSYMKTVRLGGAEISPQKVEVAAGATTEIEVLLGTDSARLSGTVRGKDGEPPAASATVVLIPDGPLRGRIDLYRVTSTDQFGGFLADNIAPGSYRILAWDEVDTGAWFDSDFMSQYWKDAIAWEAKANSQSNLDLHIASSTAR